jgi:hypothetical protein
VDFDDYLREEALKYRKLAEQADDQVIRHELLELADVCPAEELRRRGGCYVSAHLMRDQQLAPETLASNARAFGHRRELRPYHVRIDGRLADPGAESAIASRDHVFPTNQFGIVADAVGNQLGISTSTRSRLGSAPCRVGAL